MVMSPSLQEWEVFFRWAFANSVINSNTELAGLSNVCKKWRSILTATILEEVTAKLFLGRASGKVGSEPFENAHQGAPNGHEMLLLPSMVNKMINDAVFHVKEPSDFVGCYRGKICRESFCLAWFPSEGIVETANDLYNGPQSESWINYETSTLQEQTDEPMNGDIEQKKTCCRDLGDHSDKQSCILDAKTKRLTQLNSTTFGSCISNCFSKTCIEWRGYRSANEVLTQFGFAETFIENVLRAALALHQPKNKNKITGSELYYSTTFAVRGATVARPDQCCLCLDARSTVSSANLDSGCFEVAHLPKNSPDDSSVVIDLQRDFLPRTVELEPHSPIRTRRCVQFLNSSGSNAVCMVTPPFACGPIPEPITVFCVGVATEDGCFMSSLNHPFEIGHNYPFDDIAKCTDMSSISLTTVPWNDKYFHPASREEMKTYQCFSSPETDSNKGSLCHPRRCRCVFKDNVRKTEQIELGDNRTIHRGLLGPGSWHCYTGIFDGLCSQIRIDGIVEPTSHRTESGEYIDMNKNQVGIPMLDGLTIGSDHCFGMSLCCGNGSDCEGEGAISELVVFSGRLCEEDLFTIERNLMTKHKIMSSRRSPTLIWKDDSLQRQAHALMIEEPRSTSTAPRRVNSIPLSYLARHRSVAWRKLNPVTHQPMLIYRIGQTRSSVDNSAGSDF